MTDKHGALRAASEKQPGVFKEEQTPLICKTMPCSFIRLHVASNIRNNNTFQLSTSSKHFLFPGRTVQLLQPVCFLAIHVKFQVRNLPALEKSLFSMLISILLLCFVFATAAIKRSRSEGLQQRACSGPGFAQAIVRGGV